MKAIEEIQQLDPNPKIARANALNQPLAGSRETPKGKEAHAKRKEKTAAIMAAVRQRLQAKR